MDLKETYPKDVKMVSGEVGDRLSFDTVGDELFIVEIGEELGDRTYYPMSTVHSFKIGFYQKRG